MPGLGDCSAEGRGRVFLVAECGVHSPKDARRMVQAGADALLVGERS